MPEPQREAIFRTANDVIEAYFSQFDQDQDLPSDTFEPRMAGERLARSIAEATKAKVQEAITDQRVS